MPFFLKNVSHLWNLTRRTRFFRPFQMNLSCSSYLKFPISNAESVQRGEYLKVKFDDNSTHEYPYLFLQDNCRCPECFHPSSVARLRKMPDMKIENFLHEVQYEDSQVKCIWKDKHESVFTENWLKERRFTPENSKSRISGLRENPVLVGSNYKLHSVAFDDIVSENSTLLSILNTICQYGVALITGAPRSPGQVRKLAEKIGFVRVTHYGHEFTVKSEQNAVNLAYTATGLVVHTDLPYYINPPGLQLLHCIKQYTGDDKGGKSHLVDGFNIAKQMEMEFPKEYELLCKTPLEFFDIGKDFIDFLKVHHTPTFVFDPVNFHLTRVAYSNMVLSSYQPMALDAVNDVYKALKVFTDLCYLPKNLIDLKLKEGEMLIFDNWRYLHGRESYDVNSGDRHLEGCYVDWDEAFSRIRILQNCHS